MPNADELALDQAFWSALSVDAEMRAWLQRRTKFWGRTLTLVADEKWHQRWYRDPETGKDSETDVLLIWRDEDDGERFATHIENKPAHRSWEQDQARNYRRRAEDRKGPWEYRDYELVLMTPIGSVVQHLSEAAHFDFVLTYEEVGKFVPAFAEAAAFAPEPSSIGRLQAELLRRPLEPWALEAHRWLADVRLGRFDKIPADLTWANSSYLAHMINGYELQEDLIDWANQRLARAEATGDWMGDALELWTCLFAEHRREHHAGWAGSGDEQRPLYDSLCRSLRASLQV